MKANHNFVIIAEMKAATVSNGSKILKWKQITTEYFMYKDIEHCFQWFKDTKMKANHNYRAMGRAPSPTVSNGSKILKWKQITTYYPYHSITFILFPMVQRY